MAQKDAKKPPSRGAEFHMALPKNKPRPKKPELSKTRPI